MLFDTLFVADIDKNFVIETNRASVRSGDEQTRFADENRKTEGLQGNGLASRVRAGDDHHEIVLANGERDWDAVCNKRVADVAQVGFQVGAYRRLNAIPRSRQTSLGQTEVEVTRHIQRFLDIWSGFCDEVCQVEEDTGYLLLLVGLQNLQPVVEVDHPCGLDKQGHATVGLVVDNRLNCILELSFHRDHVPVVPLRFDAVLIGPAIGFATADILEYLVDCLLYTSDAADDLLCVDLG